MDNIDPYDHNQLLGVSIEVWQEIKQLCDELDIAVESVPTFLKQDRIEWLKMKHELELRQQGYREIIKIIDRTTPE